MSRGIIIFGAAGSGKTTLGRELAGRLGFLHIDIDDYICGGTPKFPILFSAHGKSESKL